MNSDNNQQANRFSMKMCCSLYTDNSRVYYKSNSLAAGGVGTVKNSRKKSTKT
jgi:hypothetical protein